MKNTLIGVDVGGTSIKIGAVRDGKIMSRRSFPTPTNITGENLAYLIADAVNSMAKKFSTNNVGIGMPGIINSTTGEIVYSNNIKLKDVPFKKLFAQHSNLTCSILNDANTATLGEWKYGAGRGSNNLVMLTLGTGVGCGTVLNGMPPTDSSCLSAGGHIIIRHNGRQCTCGNRGCLEAYASATALLKQAVQRAKKSESLLNQHEITAKSVFECAKMGDVVAKKCVDEYIEYLATGVASIYNLLFPDVVVLGGGVSCAGQQLADRVRERASQLIFNKQHSHLVKVVPAQLGNDAGIIGATVFAEMSKNLKQ